MGAKIDRRTTLIALAGSILTGCGGGGDGVLGVSSPPPLSAPPPPPPPPPPPRVVSSGAAVKWSDLATNAMLADTAAQPPGLSPMEQSRILAIAFLAGHDAVNSIQREYQRYRAQTDQYASLDPAVAPYAYEVAVSGVLRALMPGHAAEFDRALQESLALGSISPSSDVVQLGNLCAQTLLTDRSDDGSANAQGPYTPGSLPGDYRPTMPINVATFVNWGQVRPFVMNSGDQFRAPPPYDVASPAYTADFNEVKSLGAAVVSTRTAEQSEIAKFWLESTPLSWQRIVSDLIAGPTPNPAPDPGLWFVGRLFSAMQMAQADAYIACLESKYHYNYWRPITAIQGADADGNPATTADPTWEPFDPVTPPVPEYPSAHAAAAAAGAMVMNNSIGWDWEGSYLSSTASVPRAFHGDRYVQIAREIALSRIYVGYHFRHGVDMGWAQGRAVGEAVAGATFGAYESIPDAP